MLIRRIKLAWSFFRLTKHDEFWESDLFKNMCVEMHGYK